ncbi:ComEC/Rec2 family competence protein [Streptomyces sp. SM12]|uniref:ComEC/Rec2 family competence protein n=1 Tax=unclassified Streptomyces TaxID=2593676 RepID=UPI000CD522D8
MSALATTETTPADDEGDDPPPLPEPFDLRLVPPAMTAWAAAALALELTTRQSVLLVVGCALAAALAGCVALRPGRPLTVAVALALVAGAAGGASAGLHAAAARSGPLPGLAEREAVVTAEVTLTGDPRLARPKAGAWSRPVLVPATVDTVSVPGGSATRVRTPVLLIVSEPDDGWLRLLPSTRLQLSARTAPPSGSGADIAAVLFVRGSGPPQPLAGPSAVQRAAGMLRERLREATDGLPADPRGLLPALIVGDPSRVPEDLDEAVRATDLTHMIVVSGAHLSLVLAVLIGSAGTASRAERGGLAARFGVPLRVTAILGGALVLGFVVLCRPGPSVLRAAVCGAITLLAIATGRRRSLLPALAAATLLLILYDPTHAQSFGFLLSVLATGALLTIAPGWSLALQRRGVPPRLAEGLAVAAAAQSVCAPVVAVFSARVSLVAIPANLLAELAFAPVLVIGWTAMLVAPVAMPPAEALAWLASWPARWIAWVARTGAALPGAEFGWPDGWWGAALLAALTVALVTLARVLPRHPWLAAGCALLVLLAAVRPQPLTQWLSGWPPPGWSLVACDVGQGDALVLSAGPGAAVVVDAGPDPGSVDDCLRTLGVRHVPLVVLSHFHADHVGGLAGVMRGRTVGEIHTTGVRDPASQAELVSGLASAAGVPIREVAAGEGGAVGELSWEVLWPPGGATALGANDASVTLLVRAAELTMLLPGDLEPPAQRQLLAAHPDLPPVDVLKVAHHGSAYQEPALLDALRPRWAVVSAGADNTYGHPAPATLRALEEAGATVLRTDVHGGVALTPAGAVVMP